MNVKNPRISIVIHKDKSFYRQHQVFWIDLLFNHFNIDLNIFLKWFLKRKLLYNYQYIHNLFFQKRAFAIAATTPYPCTQKYAFGGTPHPPRKAYVLYDWPRALSCAPRHFIGILTIFKNSSLFFRGFLLQGTKDLVRYIESSLYREVVISRVFQRVE